MRSTLSTSDEIWQQQFKQHITQVLQQNLSQSAKLYLGCSGGMDSMLLLHLFAQFIPQRIHVLSIDHQLQSLSATWSALVAKQCQHYQIPCTIIKVEVSEGNLEAAARQARYQAFENVLQIDDVLILAHHQQDQAETVLLRILQGTGVGGLSAMKALEQRVFKVKAGQYWLWRPLLDYPKQKIEQWIQQLNVDYVDDPMNHDLHYDRVWCRDELWPVLQQRFPKMQESLVRCADLMQDADIILNEVLESDLSSVVDSFNRINIDQLNQLSLPRQRQLLSIWMQADGLYRPPFAMVQRLQAEVLYARQDAVSVLHYAGYYFTRFDGQLYRYTNKQWQEFQQILLPMTVMFAEQVEQQLIFGLVSIQWQSFGLDSALLNQELQLLPRQGGEKILLHGKIGHRPLKKLLQDAKIAPWYRHQIQILMYHNVVLGVFTPKGFWLAQSQFCQEGGWCPQIKMIT